MVTLVVVTLVVGVALVVFALPGDTGPMVLPPPLLWPVRVRSLESKKT